MSDDKPKDSDFTELPPGAGGWVPPPWAPWAAGGLSTALGGIGAVLLAIPEPTMATKIVGGVLLALASGAAALAGVSSAGPRKAP